MPHFPNAPPETTALEDIETHLARMRSAGEIDDVGEGVLRRHFEERAQALADNVRLLLEEYQVRTERDGEDAACGWLADAAETLGRRDREETQRIMATVLPAD